MTKNQYIQPRVETMVVCPDMSLMLLGSGTGPQPGMAPTRIIPTGPGTTISSKRVL